MAEAQAMMVEGYSKEIEWKCTCNCGRWRLRISAALLAERGVQLANRPFAVLLQRLSKHIFLLFIYTGAKKMNFFSKKQKTKNKTKTKPSVCDPCR